MLLRNACLIIKSNMAKCMFMMPIFAFIHMSRDANGDDLIIDGCMQQLQDASYNAGARSKKNRVHPLHATDRA